MDVLTCERCKLALPMTTPPAGVRELQCAHCGHQHTFATPPSEVGPGDTPFRRGEHVLVQRGGFWWYGYIDEVEPELLVSLDSWSDPPRRVPSRELARLPAGSASGPVALVAVLLFVAFFAGVVATVEGRRADTFPRAPVSVEQPSTPTPARPVFGDSDPVLPTSTLEEGQALLAEHRDYWYPVTILALEPDGRVRIHYQGWEARYDETVSRERLRFPIE